MKGMTSAEWESFLDNSIKHVWRTANVPWIRELFGLPALKSEFLFCEYLKMRFLVTQKAAMPTCEYVVTTRCTMRCRHCNTGIPYFNGETHLGPVSFETFKQDIDTLLDSVDFIYAFGFVGGEPLLNNDLHKMLSYAVTQKKIQHIFIATNCTILPSNELISAMKSGGTRFAVQISDYRDVKNIQSKLEVKYQEFKSILKKNEIMYSAFHEKHGANWHSLPEIYYDKQSPEKIRTVFKNCFGRYCNMLCDGILSQCTISVYINRCMQLSLKAKDELVDVRIKGGDLAKQIVHFYSHPYSEFCHYCHWENVKYNLPFGEQLGSEDV